MPQIDFSPHFKKQFEKADAPFKEKIKRQIEKIIHNPEIGKPMQYTRKGTREVYIKPYRLSYFYFKEDHNILFFDIYHKDDQ